MCVKTPAQMLHDLDTLLTKLDDLATALHDEHGYTYDYWDDKGYQVIQADIRKQIQVIEARFLDTFGKSFIDVSCLLESARDCT